MSMRMQQWLETAAAQLRCKKAVPGVRSELESHLNEQYHAYLSQGLAPDAAEAKAVAEMGDPVLTGGALDRVHRPRPAWGPFCAAALLFLAGGLLRFWENAALRPDGATLWQNGAGILCSTLLSILVLGLVHFCMDVSLLARWARQVYGAVMLLAAGYSFLWPTVINGRRYGSLFGFGLYTGLDFTLLFLPAWAAVVYRQRGRKWAGFAQCALFLMFGVLACLYVPQLSAALLLALSGWIVGFVCCRDDWFGVGKQRGMRALVLLVALLLAAACAVLLWAVPDIPQAFARQIAAHADSAGAGYWTNGLRRMWDGMRWFAPGDETLLLGEATGLVRVEDFVRQGAATLCADFLPVYVGWRYGAFWMLTLLAAIGGALICLWRTALRIRSCIGRLCAVSVCTLLSLSGILSLCACTGLAPSSIGGMLPFWGSGANVILQAAAVGLLLSAFRLDDVLREPSAAPRPAPKTA